MEPGEVISYWDMCQAENASLRRGMNFGSRGRLSVILMSLRPGAPYADRVEDDGRTLVYEGHDVPRGKEVIDPKALDQPRFDDRGRLTQNGLFERAASQYREGGRQAELVRVYEKLRMGIWVYNGVFRLVDSWIETVGPRKVFKFRLETTIEDAGATRQVELDHNRLIPSWVKLEVWQRDGGRCVICGSRDNLHFDHVIPYSRGGSSLVPENIQLLCARHNIEKKDKIG